MADYKPTVLTKAGLKILQKVIQGRLTLNFSKIEVGIGQVENADEIENLTSLIDSKINVSITNIKNNEDGSCSVCGSYTNEGVTDSFTLNEIGVFVKDEDDNDVLYAYSTADGNGDFFGAGSTLLQENIEILVYVSTATNITANITHTVKASDVDMGGVDMGTVIIGMQEGIEGLVIKIDTNAEKVLINESDIINIKKDIPVYDRVIKTQEQFDELINSGTWLDAKSVALVGSFTSSKSISVPNNVCQVDGYNNCEIGFGALTSDLFIGHSSTSPCNVSGIKIIASSVNSCFSYWSSVFNCLHEGKNSVVFESCTNLINCSCPNNNNKPAFQNCNNLTNCDGNGFKGCENLTNCHVDKYRGTYSFQNCNNLNNCTSKLSTLNFYICTNLVNCIATNNNVSGGAGFNTCDNLTNCTSDGVNYGIINCTNLNNCIANGNFTTGSISGFSFSSCKGVNNCTANIKNTTSGYNYGFNACQYINGAKKGADFNGTLWNSATTKRDDNSCDLS